MVMVLFTYMDPTKINQMWVNIPYKPYMDDMGPGFQYEQGWISNLMEDVQNKKRPMNSIWQKKSVSQWD